MIQSQFWHRAAKIGEIIAFAAIWVLNTIGPAAAVIVLMRQALRARSTTEAASKVLLSALCVVYLYTMIRIFRPLLQRRRSRSVA
jgi:hypothetical protein